MGCASHRKKQTREFADQKWDYISLKDFRARGCGCGPIFAYCYLWFMLIISIAVYAVDSFTAVNLLAFSRWSSKIEPAIPISVSKWIFSICILLSFVNLAFESVRAFRVVRRGNVAECFLDGLAARWESIRICGGQGWRRFLVFAALAKSKKGSEYVALFTYFSFQSWIRVIFCSGPRQVVNAITLRSVYVAKLSSDATSVDGAILGFFDKIKLLAMEDFQQALILAAMCFTLVIWIFSALFLLMACFFYVFFLFHWIPRADGGLTGYCERKVNKKLLRIVSKKVNKALAKGQADRWKAELKNAKKNGEKTPSLDRSATLPTLPYSQEGMDDALPQMPTIGRDESTTALPMYTSRPSSPGNIEMGSVGGRRPVQRTATAGSVSSFSSHAPLVSSAADFGYGRSQSPAPSLPESDYYGGIIPPTRPGTSNSQRSLAHSRIGFGSPMPQPNGSPLRNITASPALTERSMPLQSGPARTWTNRSMDSNATAPPAMGRNNTGPVAYQPYSAAPPAAHSQFHGTSSPLARSMTGPAGPMPPQGPQHYPPQRNMTAPVPQYAQRGDPHSRSGTPQNTGRGPYGYDLESQPNGGGYY